MLRPVWVGVLVEMLSLFGSTFPVRFGFPSKSDALLEAAEVVEAGTHNIGFYKLPLFLTIAKNLVHLNSQILVKIWYRR